jgi:hypothetical protein
MVDYTGTFMTEVPAVSINTSAVLKHKAKYYNGTSSVSIPLVKGRRYVILALVTTGNTISIGFGLVAGTITDSRFTYTVTAGPLDLSEFFNSAPFGQYKEPNASFAYLIINGEAGKVITFAVSEMGS